MSRYTDVDGLKEALKQNLPQYMWGEMLTTVNIQPGIEIVFCKTCRWARPRTLKGETGYRCLFHRTLKAEGGYCDVGERREGE